MTTYSLQPDLSISLETLMKWDEVFVPAYDFFYFENTHMPKKLLNDEVLLYSRTELDNDKRLTNLNVTTAFMPWNVDKAACYVAVVPNSHFQSISLENRMAIFHEQWRVGRGQIWELSWIHSSIEHLEHTVRTEVERIIEQNTFMTQNGKMFANQQSVWRQLPQEARVALLLSVAKMFSDDLSVWSELSQQEKERLLKNHAGIVQHFNTFGGENGPNCFATALAGATKDSFAVEWVINQWIQPKETLLLSLAQRGYEKCVSVQQHQINEIMEGDILVWVNADKVPLHACYSLGNELVFNKNSQLMFSPRQVTFEKELLKSWNHVIENGGELHIYRLVT